MNKKERIEETLTSYQKHGWQLRRILLRPETISEVGAQQDLAGARVQQAEIDALWFSRPSHQGREAWELRIVGETQYALFETFEPDEAEEDREELRLEMEARMREYVGGGTNDGR
ncbi:MAG: hypothetical protein ABJB97_02645 [Acidobacteriota bacterium]